MILTSNDRSLVISIVSPFVDTALSDATYVRYIRCSIGGRHAECKGLPNAILKIVFGGRL